MKKVVCTLVILVFAATMSFAGNKKEKKSNPNAECRKNCEQTFKTCMKEAKKDKAAKDACVSAKKDCNKNCATPAEGK